MDDTPPCSEVARAFHIANFVPVNWGAQDPISRSLVDFQFRREPQTTQWIRLALVGADGLGPVDVILRALSSRESVSDGLTSLDRLGSELAQRTGTEYAPGRLTKTRVAAPVKNAGIREARDRILRGVYVFDASGLDATSRILVLDDIVTTGATFGAITAAIRISLPNADVRYFALGRTDPWLVRQHLGEDFARDPDVYRDSLLGNAHLDPRYFLGAAAAARKGKDTVARHSVPAPRTVRPHETTAVSPLPSLPVVPPVSGVEPEAAPTPAVRTVAAPPVVRTVAVPPVRTGPVRRQSEVPWRAIAVALVAIGIVFVTFVLTQSTQPELQQAEMLPPPAARTFDAVSDSPPAQQPARPKVDSRPRGVINVPIVGLRMEPSITSGPVPDAIVRVGDKVIVVKTVRPDVGPDWFYVETVAHKYGWVIAPVVTLGAARPATR